MPNGRGYKINQKEKRVEYLIGLFLGIVIALISPKGGSQWIQKQSLS